MNSKQLARYIVLSVEPILSIVRPSAKIGKQRNPKVNVRGRSSSIESSAQSSVGGTSQGKRWRDDNAVVDDKDVRNMIIDVCSYLISP